MEQCLCIQHIHGPPWCLCYDHVHCGHAHIGFQFFYNLSPQFYWPLHPGTPQIFHRTPYSKSWMEKDVQKMRVSKWSFSQLDTDRGSALAISVLDMMSVRKRSSLSTRPRCRDVLSQVPARSRMWLRFVLVLVDVYQGLYLLLLSSCLCSKRVDVFVSFCGLWL